MSSASVSSTRRRAVLVGGLRTPFVKSSTVFKSLSALELGSMVVSEMVARLDLDPSSIDRLIYGQVIINPDMPNIAREVLIASGLPLEIDAYSVSRACATSTQALVDGAMAIMCGDADVVVCGGVDSTSKPPVQYSEHFVDVLMAANAAREPLKKAKALLDLKPADFVPRAPAIKEPSTGLTMGESAEKMAKENHIARADQDLLAYTSHQRAAAAWENGIYAKEVMPVFLPRNMEQPVERDNLIRSDTTLEKLATLKPVFDKKYGTITAGNSSPLTDGASAVVLMEESRAQALGYEPLAVITSWAFAAVDPNWQLLMGPALAAPKALQRAGRSLADMHLIDMHEAFAAQVLSNIAAIGEIDRSKLNVLGGSIALGHPFAATGTRQALSMARELQRRGSGKALITQCAAGGLGAALVLER